MTVYVQSPTGALKYTFEFADAIPENIALTSVNFTVPDALTIDSIVTDLDGQQSTIQLSGIQHGGLYQVIATGGLSNTESVPSELVIRGFSGATG